MSTPAALLGDNEEGLATFRKRLVNEIRELLATHREDLVSEFAHQLKLGPFAVQVADGIPNQTASQDLRTVASPLVKELHETVELQLDNNLLDSGHLVKPMFSSAPHEEDDDEDETPNKSAAAELRLDGAFSSIFASNDASLDEPHYHVDDYYHTTGTAQAIARSESFHNITLGVIFLNAVYIGVDADWNDAETLYKAEVPFILCENLFCAYFAFEWWVRLLAFEKKRSCLKDGWFRFDSCLMLLMAVETWIFSPIVAATTDIGGQALPVGPLRLLRLVRLTRMARLMNYLPELVTMTRGMVAASRAVFSSLLMVLIMVYTFAIVLNMGLKTNEPINEALTPRNFLTIPRTMWTLLVDGTLMDDTGALLSELAFSGQFVPVGCCALILMFILLSAITMMNMLIGVLCEVVTAIGHREKEDAAVVVVKQSILQDLKKFDDGDGLITKAELLSVMNNASSKQVLKSLKIDRLFLLELQTMLFPKPDSHVTIRGIMELMLLCRGDLPVTVQHIASAQASMISLMGKFEQRLCHQLSSLASLPRQVSFGG
jgi:hypothetical protein